MASPVLRAIVGTAPTVAPVSTASPLYASPAMGLSVRYPAGWTYVPLAQAPVYYGVSFYPPGADPSEPSAAITFNLNTTSRYDASNATPPLTTRPQPFTVGSIIGRNYESAALPIPTENYSIELPFRGGTLLITATEGPDVNYVPQLRAMLPTLVPTP